MKILYIGANWPQPWITAAGMRTVDLIKSFKKLGFNVNFFSIKKPNPYQTKAIECLDVNYGYIPLNNLKEFKKLVKDPEICVFETSRIEEMFGHMLYNHFRRNSEVKFDNSYIKLWEKNNKHNVSWSELSGFAVFLWKLKYW